jgi:hypothetical protein
MAELGWLKISAAFPPEPMSRKQKKKLHRRFRKLRAQIKFAAEHCVGSAEFNKIISATLNMEKIANQSKV